MRLFNKKETAAVQMSQQQMLENTVKNSRNNILLVLLFTILNIFLLVSNSNTYFLFSAYIPYALADLGMLMSGRYPAEIYETLGVGGFFDDSFLIIMLAIAAAVLVLYALCWVFSKKKPAGWLTFGLVLFCIDTAMLLLMQGINLNMYYWLPD